VQQHPPDSSEGESAGMGERHRAPGAQGDGAPARPSTSVVICGTISCQARSRSIPSARPMTSTMRRPHHEANARHKGGSATDILWEELAGGVQETTHLVWVTLRRLEQEP
jgi:hypothetical protein